MADFGCDDPREIPAHLFSRSLYIDYASAVRANPGRQNCSICPRYWYVDAIFRCDRCGEKFAFTAAEQRAWYEEYRFWVDSLPRHCLRCRRELKAARRDYDQLIEQGLQTDDFELKRRLARVIDELYEVGGAVLRHNPGRQAGD